MLDRTFRLPALARRAVFCSFACAAMCPPLRAATLPTYATSEEKIHGRIIAVDAADRRRVHDDRGFVDHVALHNSTAISPLGLRLAAGESAIIHGVARGSVFDANEIDTPYSRTYAVPAVPFVPYGYAPVYP